MLEYCKATCPGGASRPCSGHGRCTYQENSPWDATSPDTYCECDDRWIGEACERRDPQLPCDTTGLGSSGADDGDDGLADDDEDVDPAVAYYLNPRLEYPRNYLEPASRWYFELSVQSCETDALNRPVRKAVAETIVRVADIPLVDVAVAQLVPDGQQVLAKVDPLQRVLIRARLGDQSVPVYSATELNGFSRAEREKKLALMEPTLAEAAQATVRWSQVPGLGDLDTSPSPDWNLTALEQSPLPGERDVMLVIRAGALTPGSRYTMRAEAMLSGAPIDPLSGLPYASKDELTIVANAPPSGGFVSVTPRSG